MSKLSDDTGSPAPFYATPSLYRWLFCACALLTLSFGIAKVQMLRAYPPEYAQNGFNSYEGFVSGDGFSHRSELIRDWLVGNDKGGEKLQTYLANGGHPHSILVPTLVGATSIVTQSIPWTFVGWSSLALIVQALLVVSIAKSLQDAPGEKSGSSSPAHWILGSLFLGHCLTMRTAGQLHIDPFCGAAMLGTTALSIRFAARSRASTGAALVLVQVLGVFTKASYLPALAFPAIVLRFGGGGKSWSRSIAAMLTFGALPLAVMLLFVELVPGRDAAGKDFGEFLHAWHLSPKDLGHFAIEMLLLLQFWPVLLLARRRHLGRGGPILICALLVLLATWVFKLPAVPRLYLPVLGLGLAGAGGALSGLLENRRALFVLAAILLANYGVAVYGTFGFLL